MLKNVLEYVGQTPIVKLENDKITEINLFVKLESFNATGSVKDRAAKYIIDRVLKEKIIDKDTVIIESSSGNFGIALSSYCKSVGLKFYCVIDPHISRVNEMIINKLSTKVIKVDEPDENGGYLLTRINKVNELKNEIKNSYWVNQYGNPYNAMAYYHTLAEEICNEVDDIEYVFLGISSGGTITGVSRKIKERYKNAKVIAVDIYGSVIFGGKPKKRYIPGIGSSKHPDILKHAMIDEVVMIDEISTIDSCNELLENNFIFAGGSSGSVYAAIKKYFSDKKLDHKPNVVAVFADRGERYIDTVYNEEWKEQIINDNKLGETK